MAVVRFELRFFLINLLFKLNDIALQTFAVFRQNQHESATGTHMFPPSWTSLPHPTISHLSWWLQGPSLSSLSHTANSHWLSILYVVVYMFPCHSLHSSHPFLPSPSSVHKSVFYVCISMWSISYLIKAKLKIDIVCLRDLYVFYVSLYLFPI